VPNLLGGDVVETTITNEEEINVLVSAVRNSTPDNRLAAIKVLMEHLK
jgi:hypothetical protein